MIQGRDSAKTNSIGFYTIKLKYDKGVAAYRHIVYVPGYTAKYVNLPMVLKGNIPWITTDYEAAAVLPTALADTVRIIDGLVTTANVKVVSAGIIRLGFPYTTVPITGSVQVTAMASLDGITSDYSVNLNQPRQFRPGYVLNSYASALELPSLANRKIIIETAVYEAGSGILKKTVLDSVTLVQGQVYDYEVQC